MRSRVDPDRCSHRLLPEGYDFLCEPPRQCPECGLWLDAEYDESWDGEEEQQHFWLTPTSPPEGAIAIDREEILAILARERPTWGLVEDDGADESTDVLARAGRGPRPGCASAMATVRVPDGSLQTIVVDELGVVATSG